MLRLRPRSPSSNKSDFPKILAVCGSNKMPGAAFLVCKTAFRLGAGYVYHYSFDGSDFLVPDLPECIPVKNLDHFDYDAILIGPGIKEKPSTIDIIQKILKKKTPCILDASALNHLAKNPIKLSENFLITPHEGEAAKLLAMTADKVREDKKKANHLLQEKYNCHVLIKGSPNCYGYNGFTKDVVAGNASLAKAGSGDVLSGILVTAMGHINKITEEQVVSAVQLHGDLAIYFTKHGSLHSMGASDLVDTIPKLLKDIYGE